MLRILSTTAVLVWLGLLGTCAAASEALIAATLTASRVAEQPALVLSAEQPAVSRSTDPVISQAQQRWRETLRRLPNELRRQKSPRNRAAALLDWMHGALLVGGYREDGTRLDGLLIDGVYNCVSSSIVYHALAREVGLQTQIIQVPGHVYVEVLAPGGTIPVETTSPRLPSQDERRESAERRVLREAEIVALVYYNRGVELFQQQNYALSATANVAALQLDPQCERARANLAAAANNWAVVLHQAGREQEARGLVHFCRSLEAADAK